MPVIQSQTGAIVDYDELIDFLKDLVAFQKVLLNNEEQIKSSIKQVSRDWQDQKFDEYKADIDKYIKILNALSVDLDTHKTYMMNEWKPLIEEYRKNNRK